MAELRDTSLLMYLDIESPAVVTEVSFTIHRFDGYLEVISSMERYLS